MSARYSNSPALRLTIGNSGLRRILHLLLCFFIGWALCRLHLRGYPLLTILLLPVAAWYCRRLARKPWVGATLCWHQGRWTLQRGDVCCQVVMLPRCACLPWLIFLSWRALPDGRPRSLWLFPDSAPAQQLRRLRVRLTLER